MRYAKKKKETWALRGKIVEHFGTQQAFARRIGKSEQTVLNKLQGRVQFSQSDIIEWCNLLEIPKEDIVKYFFS